MQHVDIWVPFRSLSDIKQPPKKIKSNLIRNVDITINGGEPMCFGRVISSCCTSGIRRVTLVTNPVISHE